jgi:hypothetical protein
MTTLREAAQLALEALESLFTLQVDYNRPKQCGDAITALKAALEQPEQGPVAWMSPASKSMIGKTDENGSAYHIITTSKKTANNSVPLYTHPPRREWRGLTEEEREKATGWSVEHIEAKLKEKNHE